MKILIVTKMARNFGAVMQAFALRHYLARLGHDVQVAQFITPGNRLSFQLFRAPKSLTALKYNLRALRHMRAYRASIGKFRAFRELHLNFTPTMYTSYDQLAQDPPQADVYITGSDQVWNPDLGHSPAFYLAFGAPGVRKGAYAASIGLSKLPESLTDEIARYIRALDFVSVRERQAQALLAALGIRSEVTIDPTLLLSRADYAPLTAAPRVSGDYILCYFITYPAGAARCIEQARETLGCPVVNVVNDVYCPLRADTHIRDAGPSEILGLIQRARFVVTSSFHGTVFSLLYHRPFAVVPHGKTASRVTDLLGGLSLGARVVADDSQMRAALTKAPDFAGADARLDALRRASAGYIQEHILNA